MRPLFEKYLIRSNFKLKNTYAFRTFSHMDPAKRAEFLFWKRREKRVAEGEAPTTTFAPWQNIPAQSRET